MTTLYAFLFGFLGGLLIQIVELTELANIPPIQRPATFTDPLFVFKFIALPVVGGVVTLLYHLDGTALRPLLAVNIGASAPLIIKSFASAIPSTKPKNVD